MAKWVTQPRWWYQGTKINMGQSVSGQSYKMILIHYTTEIELDEFDSLADVVTAYDSNPYLEWQFYVEYYDRNAGAWYKVNSSIPYTKNFNADSCNTSIYLPLKLDHRNRISCKVRVSYTRHSPSIGEFGITWETDTKYLHGTKNNLSTASPYSSNFSSFIPSDNKGTTYFYVYPRNYVDSGAFWKNGSVAITTGNYIQNHLTIDNLDQWLEQVGIWNSWKQQKNLYGTYGRGGATSGGDITASWYNTMAGYCGANTVTGLSQVSDKTQATYIQASHFTALAKKVTTWT